MKIAHLILFIILGVVVTEGAFAFPVLSQKSPSRFRINYHSGFEHDGIAATSICSASLVRFKSSVDDDPAMLLTNGHCAKVPFGPFLKPGEVLYRTPFDLDADLLDKSGAAVFSLHSKLVLYATMTSTDVALLELTETYKQIQDAVGVKALVLANTAPTPGTPIQLSSGYWNRTYKCSVETIVPALKEDVYTFNESIRYSQPGCEIVGGTSGSPLISELTNEIIGINNTTNEDGESCTMNNPCEVDRAGHVTATKGRAYGQQTHWIYSCLDAQHKINLSLPGCLLPKP